MMTKRLCPPASLLLFALAVPGCATTGKAQSRDGATTAILQQTLGGLHRPESVVFSEDGRTLFVNNCGSDMLGPERKKTSFVVEAGAISKFSIDAQGHATPASLKFIEGLSGPLGLGILPRATTRFPAGTLLVNVGMALQTDAEGNSVTDLTQLGTGIRFFDPDSGQPLGEIALGAGSVVADRIGHPVLLPNSIAFDGEGNLYVTDTAKGGDRLLPPLPGDPGLIRISHDAIDDPSGGAVTFTSIPGVPNGVAFRAQEGAIFVVTMGGGTPEGEAIYKLPAESFPLETLPAPLFSGIGTMDGIAFTPAGTILVSRFSGDVLAVRPGREPQIVTYDQPLTYVAPADHRLITLADGTSLLAVPEQARVEPKHWDQRVRLIRLPVGY